MKSIGKSIISAIVGGAIALGGYFTLAPEETQQKSSEPIYYDAKPVSYLNTDGEKAIVDFSEAAERVTPAVVHIRSSVSSATSARSQQEIPPMFRDFFNMPDQPRQRNREASGSGVIISRDGYVVTNNHVINNATEIMVKLNDNREYKAEVVGTDPTTDLALLKIDETDLPVVPIGNSDEVKVGQWALAVGNPFNLESTVTAGIVSAKARSINILQRQSRTAIESFIQTDAAVNPGNSGGALVNLGGQLIGINTAIASPTGAYSGYSFAVPANIVVKVVEDLREYGEVQRAFLGVTIRDVNEDLAEKEALDVVKGVYVNGLSENGAAFDAGIEPGDVIVAVNGKPTSSVPELQEAIGRKRPGESVTVTINRNGEVFDLEVELKNRSGNTDIVRSANTEIFRSLGAEFSDLTEEEKEALGVDGGVKLEELYPGRLSEQTRIKKGFIVTGVNRKSVSSVKEFTKALENARGGIMLEGYYPDDNRKYYYGFGL